MKLRQQQPKKLREGLFVLQGRSPATPCGGGKYCTVPPCNYATKRSFQQFNVAAEQKKGKPFGLSLCHVLCKSLGFPSAQVKLLHPPKERTGSLPRRPAPERRGREGARMVGTASPPGSAPSTLSLPPGGRNQSNSPHPCCEIWGTGGPTLVKKVSRYFVPGVRLLMINIHSSLAYPGTLAPRPWHMSIAGTSLYFFGLGCCPSLDQMDLSTFMWRMC